MELRELNADERIALAALIEFVVLASGPRDRGRGA